MNTEATNLNKLKSASLLILFLFMIPALGWYTTKYVESEWDKGLKTALTERAKISSATYDALGISYLKACAKGGVFDNPETPTEMCSGAEEVQLGRTAALVTAGLGALVLLAIYAGKLAAGRNRKRLSAIFGPLVRIVLSLLAFSVLAQAAILVYSVYTLEAAAVHRVHVGLLGAVALGAVGGALKLLNANFKFAKIEPSIVRAELLSRHDNEPLFSLVDQIAQKLGAQAPDNIVAGLEPNFFVTSTPVKLPGTADTLNGNTLYISLSLVRLFTRDELAAVIGHELGHFRGEDTEYSKKFAPIYRSLSRALDDLRSDDGAGGLALLPAASLLAVCLNQFAGAERSIGREREFFADKAGAQAASEHALASALIKVSLYSQNWTLLIDGYINTLAEGKYFENLAEIYESLCKQTYRELDWQNVRQSLMEYVQPHPIDTHPTVGQRIEALGVIVNENSEIAKPAEESIADIVHVAPEVAQRLTVMEAYWLQALGLVVLPAPDEAAT